MSRSTKEPRALLRCAALAELTHHLDLDLAKRSGGCSSETTRARALALQGSEERGQGSPPRPVPRPAARVADLRSPDCPAHQLDPKVQYGRS